MASDQSSAIRRFILWDYPRASWQYDLIVVGILAFIFLTPREWFRDQPRIPKANPIVAFPALAGHSAFLVDQALLEGIPEREWNHKLGEILQARGYPVTVVRIRPIFDEEEQELKGYMALTKP